MGKLEEYVEHVVAEEEKYKSDFTKNSTIILSFYLNNGIGEQVSPTPAASGVIISESGGSAGSGGEVRFRNHSDLLPDNLTKQLTPLQFITWLDKFRFWFPQVSGHLSLRVLLLQTS